jgi:hypothetical protein
MSGKTITATGDPAALHRWLAPQLEPLRRSTEIVSKWAAKTDWTALQADFDEARKIRGRQPLATRRRLDRMTPNAIVMWSRMREPRRDSRRGDHARPRERRAATRRLTRAGPSEDPSDPEPPAPRLISREERERLEAGHDRPVYLKWAIHDLREAVEELAAEFEDSWPCRKCLYATLTTVALYAGIERLGGMLDEGDAT